MAEEKTEVDVLCEKLFMNKKHSANFVDEAELQKAMDFAEDYKKFLNDNKTEREVAKFVVAEAEKRASFPLINSRSTHPATRFTISTVKKRLSLPLSAKKRRRGCKNRSGSY